MRQFIIIFVVIFSVVTISENIESIQEDDFQHGLIISNVFADKSPDGYDIDITSVDLLREGYFPTNKVILELELKNTGDRDVANIRVNIQIDNDKGISHKSVIVEDIDKDQTKTKSILIPVDGNTNVNFLIKPPLLAAKPDHIFSEENFVVNTEDLVLNVPVTATEISEKIILTSDYDNDILESQALQIHHNITNTICSDLEVRFEAQRYPVDLSSEITNIIVDRKWNLDELTLVCHPISELSGKSFFYAYADTPNLELLLEKIKFQVVPKEYYCIEESDLCHTFITKLCTNSCDDSGLIELQIEFLISIVTISASFASLISLFLFIILRKNATVVSYRESGT